MVLSAISDAAGGVTGAIRRAAEATGTGFDYLVRTAMRESGMDPAARARTSSAAGAFQFIEQTWLQMVKEEGPRFGLKAQAAEISQARSGRYMVDDPAARKAILDLRHDPGTSALLAGAFTARNRSDLAAGMGRAPDEGELYAAHFLGSGGAVKLIRLAETAPDAAAAAAFPKAAKANRAIFYAKGAPRSAAEVLAALKSKHGADPVPAGTPAAMVAAAHAAVAGQRPDAPMPEPRPAPAETRPVFHAFFRSGPRQPVGNYVDRVWSGLGARQVALADVSQAAAPDAAAADGRNARPRLGAPLDLSMFMRTGVAASRNGRETA